MRILWAVDPFDSDKELMRSAAWAIRDITRNQEAEIIPVFLWSAYSLYNPIELAPTGSSLSHADRIRKDSQEELEAAIDRVRLRGLQPIQVIAEPAVTQRLGVEALTDHAHRSGADLIVVTTHARRGAQRLFFGSFAETLVLYCDLPLLVVSPNWQRIDVFDHILFSTDFSAESEYAFGKAIALARSLQSDLTLFHKATAETADSLQLLEQWASRARREGVASATLLETAATGSIPGAIIAAAEDRRSLIAMASRRGPAATTILGSVTRRVLRESIFPVWVIHPPRPRHARAA